MDNKLIKQLQEINLFEEDLFPSVTPEEQKVRGIKAKKREAEEREIERREQEERTVVRNRELRKLGLFSTATCREIEDKLRAQGYTREKDDFCGNSGEYGYKWSKEERPTWHVNYRPSTKSGDEEIWLEESKVNETVPQPGPSSNRTNWSPRGLEGHQKTTKELSVTDLINHITGIDYFRYVWDDYQKAKQQGGYAHEITKTAVRYAEYLKAHPETLTQMPPISVVRGQLKDGNHRIAAVYLLSKIDNPDWANKKLRVDLYEAKGKKC